MSRLGLALIAVLTTLAACSKSAGSPSEPPPTPKGPSTVEMKSADPTPSVPTKTPSTIDDRLRLHADEGTIAVVPPANSKAGAEAIAKITVTPKTGFHVNTEYPIKLVLEPAANVKIDKPEMTAGGRDKSKGDAEALDEQQLVLAIKLTPGQSGNYTINGMFKFAVCDKDQCLAKKEPIAITIAAK